LPEEPRRPCGDTGPTAAVVGGGRQTQVRQQGDGLDHRLPVLNCVQKGGGGVQWAVPGAEAGA
jgi:hypothetical protein